jgi:beta-lactamase class A
MSSDWTRVEQVVAAAEASARVGVSVIAPDSGRWSHNGGQKFQAASTVKIPIMARIFHRIEAGELALDDVYALDRATKTPGSGVLLHMHSGIHVTLNDLLYLMMSISDNSATNYLIDLAGMAEVNTVMLDLGMGGSVLARKMAGRSADNPDLENWATPDGYAGSIASILDGTAASPASCEAMLAILEKQQNGRRIGRNAPAGDGCRWGSKTGSLDGVCNDVGFVTTPQGTLVIAVFTSDISDQFAGEQIIADITAAALEASGMAGG